MGSIWKKVRQVRGDKMLWFGRTHTKCMQDGVVLNISELSSAGSLTGEEDRESNDRCRRLRLAHTKDQEPSGYISEQQRNEGSSLAVVLPQKPKEQDTHKLIKPIEERPEVIKVYLSEAGRERTESVRMLTDEVTQIQEVRYCLKSLREQMAARQSRNNNKHPANGFKVNKPSTCPFVNDESDTKVTDNQEESVKLREANKRLYEKLNEMEKRHREERERLQAESSEYCHHLTEQSKQLQKAEEQSEERGLKVKELQRLLENMEIESGILKDKIAVGEAELLQLKADKEEGEEKTQRCAELEKEVAGLKEKIHHLDDMLKSQQRKVRHMIEQLQNSRTVIQERDRVIRDLEEKVAYLEAENREMHDHMEYLLAGQDPPPLTSTDNKPEVVYSKPLTPTTPTNKALPFIKVIEIKT